MPDPFKQLGLTPEVSIADARARYLELARVHHPDQGGDLKAFTDLKAAYDQVLAFLSQPVRCDQCQDGMTPQQQGFTTTWLPCMKCGGSGWLEAQK